LLRQSNRIVRIKRTENKVTYFLDLIQEATEFPLFSEETLGFRVLRRRLPKALINEDMAGESTITKLAIVAIRSVVEDVCIPVETGSAEFSFDIVVLLKDRFYTVF
jgi:hypothetical protein